MLTYEQALAICLESQRRIPAESIREWHLAYGAAETARRMREDVENGARNLVDFDRVLAPQGYRCGIGHEAGAHYAWVKIDDREIDDGLCKMWVVRI
jgi:hypothetical protein